MAQAMSISSVLIASAAFAAAFTGFSSDLYDIPEYSLTFQAFVILNVYAFLCSITATGLLVEAALTFLDTKTRKMYILQCAELVTMATKGFVAALMVGVYLVMIQVSFSLALVFSLIGIVVPLILQPHCRPHISVLYVFTRCLRRKALTIP